MADPRFFYNRGPFRLADICQTVQLECTGDASAVVQDVAGLDYAGPEHVTFCEKPGRDQAIATRAGWCIVARNSPCAPGTRLLITKSPARSFAAVATMFYPQHDFGAGVQDDAVHPSARIGT